MFYSINGTHLFIFFFFFFFLTNFYYWSHRNYYKNFTTIHVCLIVFPTENKVYQFFVRARDHGTPTFENHVSVKIFVMGDNYEPPKFSYAQRSFFIYEDEQPGDVIATVKASSSNPLLYSIVPGMTNSRWVFSILIFCQRYICFKLYKA